MRFRLCLEFPVDAFIADDEGKTRLMTLLADKQRLDDEQEDVESDWLIASEELEEALGG